MKVLVACEFSQVVTKAFRDRGHEAYSCDLLPTEGNDDWHIQADALVVIYQGREVGRLWDIPNRWDMMIAFPPCTHLAVSGAKHFAQKRLDGRQQEGIDFFMQIAKSDIPRIAIENPVGIMSTVWRKPDQIIQPWQFGDPFQKTTCLWLKGLPVLLPTSIVSKGEFVTTPSGKKLPKWYSDNKSTKNRSRTFQGIADAMADQWG